jgi:hypothetical protein
MGAWRERRSRGMHRPTALKHSLLAADSRLQRAATNSPVLASGEGGDAVSRLQLALIAAGHSLPISTAQQSQLPDGIFGAETVNAVRGFQSEHALKVDGIVGKNTLEKLDRALPPTTRKAGCCSNGQHGNAERAMSFIGGANFRAAVAAASPVSRSPPASGFSTPSRKQRRAACTAPAWILRASCSQTPWASLAGPLRPRLRGAF